MYSKFRTQNSKQGFTLIELMVAIAIVAILATIGIVAFGEIQKSARDSKRKSDLEDIRKALYLYKSKAGTFCLNGVGACTSTTPYERKISASASPFGAAEAFGSLFRNGVPNDPKDTTYNYVLAITSDENFSISAKLENGTRPSSGTGEGGCVITTLESNAYNYCIKE